MKKPHMKTDLIQVLHLDSLKDYLTKWLFVKLLLEEGMLVRLFAGLYAM